MKRMRSSFVIRVQNDDPAVARAIARALIEPLRERGARVLLEGAPQGGPARFAVHVLSAARGLPGTSLVVGVSDAEQGARWLAPIDAPEEPAAAARRALAFLEEWGFIPSDPRAPAARSGSTS